LRYNARMLSVRRLIWDAWNVAHIARHRCVPEEVTYKGRIRVVGLTQSGRLLTVILAPTPDAGVYYPITARPADRKERRNYREERP
jgi:uncharacterized DUF497 family protein